MTVAVPGWELGDPARCAEAVGMVPTYVAVDGSGLFALPTIVVSVEEYVASAEQIDALRDREIEYRLALMRVGS